MAEGIQAGRLEVTVVAALDGFARELRTKVEAAAEGLAAKVAFEIEEKGLRRRLRTAVDTASKGLTAKVNVRIDQRRLRAELDGIARQVSNRSIQIRLRADDGEGSTGGSLLGRIRSLLRGAQGAANAAPVTVPVQPDDEGNSRGGLLGRIRSLLRGAQGAANAAPVTVPVQPDDEGNSRGSGGGLRARLRALLLRAQGDVDRNPVQAPVSLKMPRRGRMRGMLMAAIVALAQPAVAWITQLGAGLTALVSAAAPAVGILGTIPGLIAAAGLAAISTKVAFGGVGQALKEVLKAQKQLAAGTKLTKEQQAALDQSMQGLSKSARATVKSIAGVSDKWKEMRSNVQERLFSKVADQVKPLTNALLPKLEASLGSSAGQVGNLLRAMSKGTQTKTFAKDFDQVAASSNRVTGSLIRGLKNVGHWAGDFTVAAGPAVERIGSLTEGWTEWLRAATESNRADGSIDRFLQRSIDKSKQLLKTTVDLGHGLAGVGRAADESGNSLLKGLEFQMKYFNAWANSAKGQRRMKSFFDQSLPVYRETIGLLGDLGKGLARMATDSSLVKIVRQIRYELMPSVGSFLDTLGRALGPQLISLLSSVLSIFEQLSAAGLGLAVVVQAFAAFTVSINTALKAVPALGTALGLLLGAFLALKVLRGVTTLVAGVGTAVARGTTALVGAPGRIQAVTGAWTRAGQVYQRVATQTGGIAGAARGATAATRVMSRGLTGMLGIVGGPLGLALAGGALALMWYADKQQDAAQAAAEHRAQIQSLVDALRMSNGVIDDNVVAQARKLAVESDWGKAAGKAGVSTKQLTRAILGQGTDLDALEAKLRAAAKATEHWEDVAGGKSTVKVMTDQGKASLAAADAIGKHGTSLKDARKELEATGQLQDTFARKGVTAYDRVRDAVQRLADSTGDAESRTSALKSLIESLSGKTRSYAEATQKLNARLLEMRQYAKDNADAAKGKKVVKDGSLDTSTQLGQDLYRLSSGLADDALGKVQTAFDKAVNAGKPLKEQLAAARMEAEEGRSALISWLETLGVAAEDAGVIADQMGLIPDTVVTGLKLEGQDDVAIAMAGVQTQFKELGEPKKITVSLLDDGAREKLVDLGFKVNDLPDGQFEIVAATDAAKANLGTFIDTANRMPTNKSIRIITETAKSLTDLKVVSDRVAKFKDKPFTMKALTAEARRTLTDLGFRINSVPGANGAKRLQITAPPGTVRSNVAAIQGAINSIQGREVGVGVYMKATASDRDANGVPDMIQAQANGGVMDFFANGGITELGRRVESFARGGIRRENHVAQIAPAGSYRVWGEAETGGEGYVPLAESKRPRSKAIVEEIVRRFGGAVAWYRDGGLNGPARSAALDVNTAARRSAAPTQRTGDSSANTSLVGGDLNLNIASVGDVTNAFEDAMFQLRRFRLGGGG
ncbi:hypothetical protein [Streptomyces microflavus]|uniref:hypothetical protein n=1 Tax=Streptomyces microflavus TaxID=1919 RepID=UPI003668B206